MRTACLFLIPLLLFPAVVPVEAQNLDALVKREEALVDNEAVVVYGGKVGKLDAIFHIEWGGDRIDGWSYYPARGREKRYLLKGTNPKEGVILFGEYLESQPGELLSNSRLTKQVTGDRIIWSGQMNNTDGRQLPIRFSRRR